MKVAVLVAVLTLLPAPVGAVDLPPLTVDPNGGAAGGDALYIPRGDILNLRNIQGGTPDDPGLDVSAGDATHRGRVAINWDLGKSFDIYDGHHRLLARFDRHGITFYRKPKIVR